ncbi:Lrp/AsnC family transcriptional regulator [Salininema proteolyticum]|uniref:Lrp/AsnC family transcriptional regulator n=1 Tax=Salininema proteolyticum TaxID=1607685 RepID=A0ABV8U1E6_9ACTN
MDTALDDIDLALIAALQKDGRARFAELGRAVALSPSAVAARVKRLEQEGVIAGYTVTVDAEKLGRPITAVIRLRFNGTNYRPFHEFLAETPAIVEAHHVTGDDCFIMKAHASSMAELEKITGRVCAMGPVTTSVVYSSPLEGRPLPLD